MGRNPNISHTRQPFNNSNSPAVMYKILIINCHPNKDSFNFGLAEAYKKGALQAGHLVEEIVIVDLQFNPNLQFGYQKRMDLEPDLLEAWQKIKWAEHLVDSFPSSLLGNAYLASSA